MTAGTEEGDLATGSRLGPFVISGVLGRGGMGVVYVGNDQRTGVEAAIKTVSAGSATLMSCVRHEASTLSRIRHPGVVQVLGVGVEGGLPWYAMERLTGLTLSDLLASGALVGGRVSANGTGSPGVAAAGTNEAVTRAVGPQAHAATMMQSVASSPTLAPGDDVIAKLVADAAAQADERGPAERRPIACDLDQLMPIMRGVCDALAFVHGEGVVHRDLKPENIFIRTGQVPVLVDFGLATLIGTDGRDQIDLVGGVVGSIGYMAPEQLSGELPDARGDLYALGCILYRAVTGRLPFEGPTWRIMAGHLMDSFAPAGELVIGLPALLDELIAGLLVKDRDHRIGSAEAVDSVLAAVGGRPCRWPSPLPPPQPFLYRPPFVGRGDVLARLVERLQRFSASAERTHPAPTAGGLVLIAGESGAGKTRLALEAVKLHSGTRTRTVTCGCVAGGGPFQPLRELFQAVVEHYLEGGSGNIERVFGASAAVLALYSPDVAELPGVAELPEPEQLPSAAARTRVLHSLADTLHAFTRARPLLLIIDDIHLADSFTLDFLAHLQDQVERGSAPPVLVVGCYRSEERTPALDALAAHPDALQLAVERMTEVEVGQMVQGMLALAQPPPAFVAFLARESGGNPFFVAEYLRTAVAERVLVRDARGRWTIADTSVPTDEICEALPLPRSLRQVVELRLGKLAPRTRELLDATAVAGRRFSRSLLRLALGLGDDALLQSLDEMVAAHVIEPVDGDSYTFVHDKLHELPVAALDPARRRDLHARIAGALEQLHAGALDEHAATIGRHWAEAGQPERAAPLLHTAGDRARKVHSVDTAIELYRAARRQVDQVVVGDGEAGAVWRARARALDEQLGDSLAQLSQHEPARAAFQQVLADIEPTTDAGPELITRARMLRKIAKTWEMTHAYPQALAGYAELEALIDAAPALALELEPEWIQMMLGRAWIFYWSNRVDEMNQVIERLRPIVGTKGSALDRYRYHLALVTRDYRRDRYRIREQTLEHGRACVAAAREANSIGEIAFARFVRGFGLLFARRLPEAEAEIEAGLQASRKISDAVAETRAMSYLGLVHLLAGHLAEAETTATASLAMARARKMADYAGLSQALLGRLALAAGDAAKAHDLCGQAVATWNAMTYPFPFRWLAALVLIEQGLGRTPPAELAKLARELTAPTQAHLPDPLDDALVQASDAGERGDDQAVEQALRTAVELAHQFGYM